MRKKKKGSSLITVVIIFSILITVGTAVLSMTVGDYKMRIIESKKIENLYSSESGLDVAYDIIVKTFDKAAKFGDFKAKQFKAGNCQGGPNLKKYNNAKGKYMKIKNDKDATQKAKREAKKEFDEKVEELAQVEFKRSFKNFISKSHDNNEVEDKEKIPSDILAKSIKEAKYSSITLKDKDANDKEFKIGDKDFTYEKVDFFSNKPELFICNNDELKRINELEKELNQSPDNQEKKEALEALKASNLGIVDNGNDYKIQITSEFKTEDSQAKVNGKNTRQLQVAYNIVVPDYKDVAFSESTSEVQNNVSLSDKAMIVGRDMNVNGSSKNSKIDIDGDIFVWGDKNEITNKVYDKYKGGINIKNSTVKFNGEVVTGKTFNIESDVDSTITGNLYAMNVYAGKLNGDVAENSQLIVKSAKQDKNKNESNKVNKDSDESGQVIIDNDITLKAKDTDIEIDNFYGINDKNTKYGDTMHASSEGTAERTSSSIIVNGNENSNIKINNKAYIMGVAHIDTTPEYQTGESTGIKGNYVAYATPLDDNEKFDYYKPLQLLNEENVLKKSEHFKKYWDGKLEDKNTGGIALPESTYSIGAIVYKDASGKIQLKDSSYTMDKNKMDINTVIPKKQIEYASKVYAMGKDVGSNWYDSLGNLGSPVDYLMKLKDIPQDYDLDSQKSNNEKAIFNHDYYKTIIIKGKNSAGTYNNARGSISEQTPIVIEADKGELNAFVATAGDVIIDGEVNFNGNIIAEGNLTIQGNQDKNIKYDKDLCDRIKASNVELFNEVFGDSSDDTNSSETGDSSNPNLNVQYDLNKFLKTKLWKIIK
ncbi:hypothetical protein [Clostridium uliginosum]|uniref:PilX N-terminal n=1 Tax=Clostridium uliginosum TaxID=119641 RepID=A0A1I1PH02_9CLOT|nr:hypothetical protein [Clostridium uliginosum]SFD09114.1 hypothetical protein SAMN05421842_11941 [Clostridium uliginosum]